MKHYKYIHLLWADELKFNRPLLEMFASNSVELKSENHAFITPHKDVYDVLQNDYTNIYLDETSSNLFNKYAPKCNYLISHDFPKKRIVLGIKKKYKKKIVYRYWGGRRYSLSYKQMKPIHNIYTYFYNHLYSIAYRLIYDNLALIGIANYVDELDLKPYIKKTPMMMLNYPSVHGYELIQKARNNERDGDVLNVVLGHKSEPLERHIYYLELLSKYPANMIKIFIPLSYGDELYRDQIATYVREHDLNNVVLLTDFMPYEEYINFLGTMDVAIIDCDNSIALGNIGVLLALQKTVYLSRDGVIKKACDIDNIPYKCVDEIAAMSFDEFSSLLDFDHEYNSSIIAQPYSYYVDLWIKAIHYLDVR